MQRGLSFSRSVDPDVCYRRRVHRGISLGKQGWSLRKRVTKRGTAGSANKLIVSKYLVDERGGSEGPDLPRRLLATSVPRPNILQVYVPISGR